jgi:hypothetical protein
MTEQHKTILYILLAIAIVCVILYLNKREETYVDFGLEDGDEEEDIAFEDYTPPGMATFSLFLVPGIQPKSTHESRKYGGFHITLFPSQLRPENYSIVEAMRNFKTTNEPWNLMRPSSKISFKDAKSKNLKLMYTGGGQTIEKLKKYLQTNNTGQAPWIRPWGAAHLTLGTLSPKDQANPEDFLHQDVWYVQLVRKDGKNRGWPKNERVRLFSAV